MVAGTCDALDSVGPGLVDEVGAAHPGPLTVRELPEVVEIARAHDAGEAVGVVTGTPKEPEVAG